MFLTTKSKYAVIAMVDLASHQQNTPHKLEEIAQNQEIPASYLEQIFALLRKSDIISSHRGPGGGYSLNKTPKEIKILDIISAVEEPLNMTRCLGEESCIKKNNKKCQTHDLWKGLSDNIKEYFSSKTLNDYVQSQLTI
jgi:Rrf2 family transcriptional regulator, iron-sulfur cluster assembly transcription factor